MKNRVVLIGIILIFNVLSVFGQEPQVEVMPIEEVIEVQRSISSVMTLEAEQIRSTTAVLNGILLYQDSISIAYYFDYRVGSSSAVRVPAQFAGDKRKLTATVSGLPANSDITYQLVVQTVYGDLFSNKMFFRTLPKNISVRARSSHTNTFAGWATGFFNINNLTGKKKKLVNACNYKSETVRSKAAFIAGQSPGNFNLGQICDIFDYCYNNWHYVNDPQGGLNEIYQSASSTILNGLNGDCDDFAILTCSMLLSVGGDARLNLAYSTGEGHAFTEINMGPIDMKEVANYIAARYKNVWTGQIHYRIDKNKNCWLNLDWWAKHPGGRYYKANTGTRFYILDNYCENY